MTQSAARRQFILAHVLPAIKQKLVRTYAIAQLLISNMIKQKLVRHTHIRSLSFAYNEYTHTYILPAIKQNILISNHLRTHMYVLTHTYIQIIVICILTRTYTYLCVFIISNKNWSDILLSNDMYVSNVCTHM